MAAPPRWTSPSLAASGGAMGLPDPQPGHPIGTATDVEAFRRAMEQVVTNRGIDRLVRQTRVISASIARIAEVWVDDLREALDSGMWTQPSSSTQSRPEAGGPRCESLRAHG
ncbi:MAG: hypothetical protein M3337_07975 [Actinomycetota bacterium]|nr:hypothetical protein [Actinomycetota bacterium]